jgi:hypothetical protein
MIFLSPPMEMVEYHLKMDSLCLLFFPFQFIIHNYYITHAVHSIINIKYQEEWTPVI